MVICVRLAATCLLVAEKVDDLITCITTMNELGNSYNESIPTMATEEVVNKLCSMLDSANFELRQPSVKCLATMFSSADPSIVDYALRAGVLPRLLATSENAPTQLIEYILFALSNIAAGTPDQSKALLLEEELLAKVF